jgi:GNAT superfamily N-acetyltransferase
VEVREATEPEDFATAAQLLRDFPPHQRRRYAQHLPVVDRYFDDAAYASELDTLATHYGPPQGSVLLARLGRETVGVVCLRPLGDGACEMKRLFVPEAHRRQGIATALVNALLEVARVRGYRNIRLDTGSFMVEALALYARFGFRLIPPYYAVDPGVAQHFVFMEKMLGA